MRRPPWPSLTIFYHLCYLLNSIKFINGCIFIINVKIIIVIFTQILHRNEYLGTAFCSTDAAVWPQRAECFGMFWIFFQMNYSVTVVFWSQKYKVTHWKKSRCISQLFEGKKCSVFIVMSPLLYHCLQSLWVLFLL